ncbi:hypothetical protein FRC19_000700 [Serendipita sp. 401]|nr:hypothetical protein FRC15_007570 [Serendipita sp. 397]KAG8824962.1 hypothetical protein FRC19_000700 [Serendipita sp. 401]KAG8873624.1 hypothetical protein FRC20_007644 [Serendipita sp. 405]
MSTNLKDRHNLQSDTTTHVLLPSRSQRSSPSILDPKEPNTDMSMEIDPPELLSSSETAPISRRELDSKSHPRPSSWHSGDEEESPHFANEGRPRSSSALSRSRSLSDQHSTSHESSFAISKMSSEDPRFHAAYRLFKASVKRSSDQFGPFLPEDDGSPFLAHRLSRMWNDLSAEQRASWLSRASSESMNEHSPVTGSRHCSPSSSTAAAAFAQMRSRLTGDENTVSFNSSTTAGAYASYGNTPELRSPASFMTDDVESMHGGPSSLRSRSQSPHMGEEGASSSHVPRPPNAWILFRSTMSKRRRPDGVVYSPPEISVLWKELSQQDKDIWYERAKEAKQQHEVANPGYKYQPNRKKPRKLTEGVTPSGSSSPQVGIRVQSYQTPGSSSSWQS